MLIVAALAAAHQAGLFRSLDGRFFDLVTASEGATRPTVVIIERDPEFEAAGGQRFARLDAALAALGAERIGYLGQRPLPATAGAAAGVPIVIGAIPRQNPASGTWDMPLTDGALAASTSRAARTFAAAQYGIARTQLAELRGREAPIPVFDAALAGSEPRQDLFLVRMPRSQSIPAMKASQLLTGGLQQGEFAGTVALVADRVALFGGLSTPLAPNSRTISEALFRAHAVHTLRSGRAAFFASAWQAWLLLGIIGTVLAIAYRQVDPKRLAITLPLTLTALVAAGSWAVLQWLNTLLPVAALLLAPWLVSFQRVLQREARQDRRLEDAAARAVHHSFRRSALREGTRLPQFLGFAARIAGIERSLVIERTETGSLREVVAHNAAFADLAGDPRELQRILTRLNGRYSSREADALVPAWDCPARIAWLGSGESELYWLYAVADSANPGRSAQLVRAISASFRELFRWRANLNARSRQEERDVPVDDRVASAIALMAKESEHIRHGFDTIDTAVVIFHLVGPPLHANAKMQEIYREAGLTVSDTPLPKALAALTELDAERIDAMLTDLVLNGGEMRLPMRRLGPAERIMRVAAPQRLARGEERVLVLEAVDVSNLHRAADLRQAVAQFIDLQLRNDLEAILLGSGLAADERVNEAQIRPIVGRIGDTARRATERLDEVAELVRAENRDLVDACYPIDARKLLTETVERTSGFAEELAVNIEADIPGISGFTIAEPTALSSMIEAMLHVVIADTPQGDTVQLTLEELDGRTRIRIAGGFGIGFGRLMWLMNNYQDEAVGEYRVIGEGMAKAVGWDASVSYWGREAEGFGFNINLRRIG